MTRLIKTAAVLAVFLAVADSRSMAQELSPDAFAKLHKLMAPGPEDSQWMQVPWMASSNIYAARKKAAAEGKPLLLWYMAGEPLGSC